MSGPVRPEVPGSVLFQNFKGINNTVSSERITPDELERAENVDIDDRGQIRRRRGATLLATGRFHSLFVAQDQTVYVVREGVLSRLLPNNTTVPLNKTVGQSPLAYVQVGEHIYFSSSTHSGVIFPDDTVAPWGSPTPMWVSPVVNLSDTLPDSRGKLLSGPPLATSLAHLNGRIYLAVDRVLWATELFLYHYVDRTRGFQQYEAPITGVRAVPSGLYVGTEDAVYFLSGPYGEMRRERVMALGIIPGSIVDLPSNVVLPSQIRENGPSATRPGIMFLTKGGVCAAFDNGACYNLTDATMTFPEAQSAAAMFREQDGMSQYITVTDTGGTPTSTARVGDYVDAEIRRFSGA